MRWNRNRFSHSGKKEAWFSFDRFRVTQASASKPRKPAVSSLVGSNGKGFEPALPGERQALEAQQFEPVRVSLPRQQFLGELADPFGTAAAHEHAWFRKNCSKSRSASPRWRRRKKYRRNWKFRFSTIQLAPRPRAGPHATRCPRRPPRSRDRALAGQCPARNDAPKRHSHGGERLDQRRRARFSKRQIDGLTRQLTLRAHKFAARAVPVSQAIHALSAR